MTRRAVRLASLVLVVAAAAGGACGDDKPSPTLTAPPPAAGFTRVIGTGFTIDMPAGWHQPSLDPSSFDQSAAALRAQNPKLAAALEAARASMGQGSRLFAIDPVDGSSVNLIVTTSEGKSLAAIVAAAVKQLEQVGAGSLREERTSVGTLPAVRLEFSLPVRGETGTLAVPETQYYVVEDKRLFILTLFGDNPTLPAVAESLRIDAG